MDDKNYNLEHLRAKPKEEPEAVWIEDLTFEQVSFLLGEGGDSDLKCYINALRVLGAKVRGVNVDQRQVDGALRMCEWLEDVPEK